MKILVNLVTLQHEHILPPWLRIFKVFQSQGCEIFVNAGPFVKKLGPIGDIYEFRWLTEEENKILQKDKTATKMSFLCHCLKRNLLALKKSQKILEAGPFDVIYTPSSVLDFVIYPFYLKITGKKIKWVTTLANTVPLTDPGNKPLRFLGWIFFQISLRMIKRADVIFASTPEVMEHLIKRHFYEKKLVLTGFGIEADLIEKVKPDGKYKIDALFVGRINETKGIYDMLKALKIVREKFPDFQLAIMGEGDARTKMSFKNKIKKEGLEENVQFLGYINGMEKYNIIKSAKCFWFLSTSPSESFGVALLEAVCSGVPAYTYSLPQFSRIYQNGGVDISPLGDYKMVAEKVIRLLESGNFTNDKGKLLLGKYSWEKVAEIEWGAIQNITS
ncbi:MAG: glycosyltransferase [Patescibacteria group bacterium]|nr:glycosyltransferase [Patescibacteria group bacterium]